MYVPRGLVAELASLQHAGAGEDLKSVQSVL